MTSNHTEFSLTTNVEPSATEDKCGGLSERTWQSAWPAPAKINLFLHVVGQRADGYHLLQTVFCLVDLCDTLFFTPRSDGTILSTVSTVHNPSNPFASQESDLRAPAAQIHSENNLTTRAALALQKYYLERLQTELPSIARLGVSIRIDKNIPLGGGLGGGSSDAATTLIALNHLWGLGLSRTALVEIGLTLGADVPVFLHGKNAFAQGVGEELTAISLTPTYYLITFANQQVPTQKIFASSLLQRNAAPIAMSAWQKHMSSNHLEPVVTNLYPEIAVTLAALRTFSIAGLSGSGGCCYAQFPTLQQAEIALATLVAPPYQIKAAITQGLQQHPLLQG